MEYVGQRLYKDGWWMIYIRRSLLSDGGRNTGLKWVDQHPQNIKNLSGRVAGGNWWAKCKLLAAIYRIQGARGVSHGVLDRL